MRQCDQYSDNSVIPSRLSDKPPRPRWSRSPAYRERAPISSVPHSNLQLGTKHQELSHISREEPADRDWDFTSNLTNQVSPPDEDDTDNKSEPDSCTGSSKGLLQNDRALCDPNPDRPDLTAWIMDTTNMNVTASHPFCAPMTNHISTPGAPEFSAPRFKPEDDILTQWRLRRKMEQAHVASQSRRNTLHDHFVYHYTPSPLTDYRAFQSEYTYTCPTLPSKRSFWDVQPDPCGALRHRPPVLHTRDVDVQVDVCQPAVTSLPETGIELRSPRPAPMIDASTLTESAGVGHPEMCTKSTSAKPVRRSVGTTVYPSLREASAQTPRRFIPLTPAGPVESSPRHTAQQKKDAVRVSAIGAPDQLLNAMLGVTSLSPKRTQFHFNSFGDADEESVQTTEQDSWQWHSTTVTPEPVDSVDFMPAPHANGKNDRENGEQHVPATGNSHESCLQPDNVSNDGDPNMHPAFNNQLSESITRYLETIAHETRSNLPWIHDPIVKDLHQRRDACLLKMKLVIEEIYKQELEILEKARDSALIERIPT